MTLLESRIRNTFWLEMDQSDKDSLYDIVFGSYEISVDESNLRIIFNRIPFDDILDALKYGFMDTEVRESIHTYLKANKQLILELD